MAITVADLTTEMVTGTGIFDKMMKAAKAHLNEEFEKGRIRGPEYATVYLGLLDKVMSGALQFLLSKDKVDQEILLIQKQIEKIEVEIEVDEAEKDKIAAEIEKLEKEALLVIAQECLARAQFDVAMATIPKVENEALLLAQKKVTEQAQVSSVGVDTMSVIGRQNNLYTKQAAGFDRDAEQKAAKLLSDAWAVQRTTDNELNPAGTGLTNSYILRAIEKMLAGAGA